MDSKPWTSCASQLPPPGKLCHVRRGKVRLHDARLAGVRWIYEADDESGRTSSGAVDGTEWRLVEEAKNA